MAQTTEAACLLQSGSLYHWRIGLRNRAGEDYFAGVKQGAVSLYLGDAPIYHFDLDGRWQRAFVDGVHYLKGLDGTIRSIDREREGESMVLRRRTLDHARSGDLDDSIRSVALGLVDDLDAGRLEVLPPPSNARLLDPGALRTFLERVAAWDSNAWLAHLKRYLSTYGPIPFLPPDCPNALILQATLGHAGGRAFGRGRPAEHIVRSPNEFLEHARAVDRLVGRRLAQYRGVFLGGADLLHRPVDEVLEILRMVEQVFPIGADAARDEDDWSSGPTRLGLVHAFLDDFRAPLPDLDAWRSLRDAHLGRVTLGIESGDPEIRATYGKTWKDDDLRALIADLKAAGIGVGLVVLVGAGGREPADRHLDATADMLGSLPLEPGDLVSLVDARSLDESAGDRSDFLSDGETEAQVASVKARAAAARASKGPKLVAYNPDKQWT